MGKRGRFRVINGDRIKDGRTKGGRQQWTKSRPYGGHPPGGRGGWLRYSSLWLGAVLVGLTAGYGLYSFDRPGRAEAAEQLGRDAKAQSIWAAEAPRTATASDGVGAQFGFCHTGGGTNCVVDGDTIWLQGQNIRIADIDAPETHEPRCAEEKALGDRATQRLLQLVNSGTVTTLRINRDEDRYGRKLRRVQVDGVSVGETLVNDGLARWYRGGKRPWC